MQGLKKTYSFNTEKIRLERAKQGKSISQLAEETMLNSKTIMSIEHNRVVPRVQTIGRIAAALGKELEEFIIQ